MTHTVFSILDGPPTTVHPSARLLDDAVVETSVAQWAYALVMTMDTSAVAATVLIVEVELRVLSGAVAVGLLNRAGAAFVAETCVDAGAGVDVVLRGASDDVSALVFRNASCDGASRFHVASVRVSTAALPASLYPVSLQARHYLAESIPIERERVFDDDAAGAINTARMAFIRGLDLPLQGRRVLDIGAGVGHFARMYADAGAQVVAVEGRAENVRVLRERHPDIEAHTGDIQQMALDDLGRFDVVHCFGLLYHLDSPVAALRRIVGVCDGVLLLETMVCDADVPLMILADESRSVNQALAGLGCRPSPAFVALALNRVGFRCVYGAAVPPAHPDFQFAWRNDLSVMRAGKNLRCVFVASQRPLVSDCLYPLIE